MGKTLAEIMVARQRVATEILTTERSYVESLVVLEELYVNPLLKAPDLLSKDEVATIFGNISVICSLNKKFLGELELIMKDWKDESCLGQLFNHYAQFFKMYIVFCNGHDKGVQEYTKLLKKRSNLQKFVDTAFADPRCKKLSLESFLIMPIQRIPRYKLLLVELQKLTPPEHADAKPLEEALKKVGDVATKINEELRAQESRDKVLQIQNMFSSQLGKVPVLVAPGRKYIMEGDLTKVCRKEDKTFRFFLFSDLLVYARAITSDTYALNREIPIDKAFLVVDTPFAEGKFAFQIRNAKKSFLVYTTDAAEKSKWMEALLKCMTEQTKSTRETEVGELAPVWVPDKEAKKCTLCSSEFSILNRRHHCRKCGSVVCNDCSKHRAFVGTDGKKSRVCKTCHEPPSKREERQSSILGKSGGEEFLDGLSKPPTTGFGPRSGEASGEVTPDTKKDKRHGMKKLIPLDSVELAHAIKIREPTTVGAKRSAADETERPGKKDDEEKKIDDAEDSESSGESENDHDDLDIKIVEVTAGKEASILKSPLASPLPPPPKEGKKGKDLSLPVRSATEEVGSSSLAVPGETRVASKSDAEVERISLPKATIKKKMLRATTDFKGKLAPNSLPYAKGDLVTVIMKKSDVFYVEHQATSKFGWVDMTDFEVV